MTTKAQRVTIAQIRHLMATDPNFVKVAILVLLAKQTEDEQKEKSTKYKNDVGYNKSDAHYCTDTAIWILNELAIETDDLEAVRLRVDKYAGQLSKYDPVKEILASSAAAAALLTDYLTKKNGVELVPEGITFKEFIELKKERRKKEAYKRRQEKKRLEREELKRIKAEEDRKVRDEKERAWKAEQEKREKRIELVAKLKEDFSNDKSTEITASFIRETEKAVLVKIYGIPDLWIPKSTVEGYASGASTYIVKNWLLRKNKVIPTLYDLIQEKLEGAGL